MYLQYSSMMPSHRLGTETELFVYLTLRKTVLHQCTSTSIKIFNMAIETELVASAKLDITGKYFSR